MSKLLPHIGRDAVRARRRARGAGQGVGPTPEALYQQQKKSVALAVTLRRSVRSRRRRLYAGDGDKGRCWRSSAPPARGAVGSLFWLIHLDGQHRAARAVFADIAERVAWTGLWRGRRLSVDADLWVSLAPDRWERSTSISGSGWARRRQSRRRGFDRRSRRDVDLAF